MRFAAMNQVLCDFGACYFVFHVVLGAQYAKVIVVESHIKTRIVPALRGGHRKHLEWT